MNYLFAILIAGCVLIFGLAWLTEAHNQRIVAEAQAQAILINANAQANAVLMTAAVPMTIVLLAGLVILILAVGWILRQRGPSQHKVIERQIVYILPAGSTRRELWAALSDGRPELMKLPERIEVKK